MSGSRSWAALALACALASPSRADSDKPKLTPEQAAGVKVDVAAASILKYAARIEGDKASLGRAAETEARAKAKIAGGAKGDSLADAQDSVAGAQENAKAAKGSIPKNVAKLKAAIESYVAAEEQYAALTGAPRNPEMLERISHMQADLEGAPKDAGGGTVTDGTAKGGAAPTPIPEVGPGRQVLIGEEPVQAVKPVADLPRGAPDAAPPLPAVEAAAGPAAGFGLHSPSLGRAGGPLHETASVALETLRPSGGGPPGGEPIPRVEAPGLGGEASVASAQALMRSGDYAGALAAADRAIAAGPKDAEARAVKAQALSRLRRFGEAEAVALEAVRLDPKSSSGYEQAGWAQLHLGKPDVAEANFTKAIELKEAVGASRTDLARLYAQRGFARELKGDRSGMLADLAKAAELDPATFTNHLARAQAGQRVFDPEAEDSWRLLDSPLGPLPGRAPVGWLWLVVVLGAAGGGAGLKRVLAQRGARAGAGAGAAAPPGQAEEQGLLGGRVRLTRIIGRGAMGEVWEAWDKSLDRPVAVKRLRPDAIVGAEAREHILREARAVAALQHPNIVAIYDVLDAPEGVTLVFEFVPGKTVAQLLAEGSRLPVERVSALLQGVCAALEYAHGRGVVHRDLKPSNILVTPEGMVKVTDFGIARRSAPSDPFAASRTRTIAGTPAYMAPEALEGVVSPAADVYALGVCLYEMATGRLPFGPQGRLGKWQGTYVKPSARVPGLPPALDDLVPRALHPDPAKRIAGAGAFRERLQALSGEAAITAGKPG